MFPMVLSQSGRSDRAEHRNPQPSQEERWQRQAAQSVLHPLQNVSKKGQSAQLQPDHLPMGTGSVTVNGTIVDDRPVTVNGTESGAAVDDSVGRPDGGAC